MTMIQGYHQAKLAVLILAIRMNRANEPEELERIGNINCCNCFAMEINTESLFCRDTNEVPDVLFEGMFFICISVCLLS